MNNGQVRPPGFAVPQPIEISPQQGRAPGIGKQPPQCDAFVEVLTQAPEQLVSPALQAQPHCPALHLRVLPVGPAGQTVPQAPQLSTSLATWMQLVPQAWKPPAVLQEVTQAPPEQVEAQTMPQAPQLEASVWALTQASPQRVKPGLQSQPQPAAVQLGWLFSGPLAGQTVPQAPQLEVSASTSTQPPPQQVPAVPEQAGPPPQRQLPSQASAEVVEQVPQPSPQRMVERDPAPPEQLGRRPLEQSTVLCMQAPPVE